MSEPQIVERVLYGADEYVGRFVANLLPIVQQRGFDNPTAALGVVVNDRLIGGVVYHTYRPGIDIEVSLAFENPRWSTKTVLSRLFAYPFIQLGVERMTCITSRKNKRARKLCKGLGFKEEGICAKAYDGKSDAVVYGMIEKNCRWLEFYTPLLETKKDQSYG